MTQWLWSNQPTNIQWGEATQAPIFLDFNEISRTLQTNRHQRFGVALLEWLSFLCVGGFYEDFRDINHSRKTPNTSCENHKNLRTNHWKSCDRELPIINQSLIWSHQFALFFQGEGSGGQKKIAASKTRRPGNSVDVTFFGMVSSRHPKSRLLVTSN